MIIYLKILIIVILLLIIFYIFYYNKKYMEGFEDKFEDHETYEEIYDIEFVDLYEIIYRDFSDIDFDINILNQKIIDEDKNNINFLVCGSGVGKVCKKLKDKYKNVIGVDISENMLKKSQFLYPNIKFIRGNIIKDIFDKNMFSHIYIDERTLYYNKINEIEKIVQNTFYWLKERGYLIAHIYDPQKLQLASRYYSSKYIDNKGNIHGFTYLNDFSHDCYYIKDENNIFYYYDKIIFDTGHKRIKKTTFYIPPKEQIYDIFLNNGFEIFYIEKIRLQIVGGYELAIFRKKKQIYLVDDLEKNNK